MSNENLIKQWREARRSYRRAVTSKEVAAAVTALMAVEARMTPKQLELVHDQTTGGAS